MAIAYSIIKKEVALRSAQLSGTNQSTLETAYNAFTLDGAEIPASSIKSVIIDVEAELHHVIGADASHPYRSYISGTSAALSNLASTPSADASGNPFVGVFGSTVDGSTGQPLTAMPTETLTDYQNSFFSDTALYNFCIFDNTIQHTRATAKLVGCVFNRTTAETNYDADGNSPLPPILATTWIAGALANLPQVGWSDSTGALAQYASLYEKGLGLLRMGASQQINLPLASQSQVAG